MILVHSCAGSCWGGREGAGSRLGGLGSRGVGCQPALHSWDVSVGPILSSALGQAPARCIPTALPMALLLAVLTLPLVSASCPLAQSTCRVSPGEGLEHCKGQLW